MARVRSLCPLDCPDACSIEVETDGDRLVAVRGVNDRNPLTAGVICAKVANLAAHVHGEDRIMSPLVRTGPKGSGRFAPISWDQALDHVAHALAEAKEQHGGASILPCSYGGSNGALTEGSFDRRLFWRLGASRLHRNLCAAPSGAAAKGLYGKMPGIALEDYEHADLIVVWGCNPKATGIHFLPVLRRAQKRGAKLVVVDPRRTWLAAKADLHLPVRPGTDLPVALGLIRWLFDHGTPITASWRSTAPGSTRSEPARRHGPWRRQPPPPGSRSARCRPSPSGTRQRLRLRSAVAGGWSATATVVPPSPPSSPFQPWPGSSVCAAAGTRCRTPAPGPRRSRRRGRASARQPPRAAQPGRQGPERRRGPRRSLVRLQLQPAGHPSGPGRGGAGSTPRRPVHGGVRRGDDRHGALR